MRLSLAAALASLALVACAPAVPADPARTPEVPALEDAASVAIWAESASPARYVNDALAAVGTVALAHDAGCPRITQTGAIVAADGECVDAHGTTHHGQASLVAMPSGERAVTLEDVGVEGGPRTSGQVTLDENDGLLSFHAELRVTEGEVTTDVLYDGTFEAGVLGVTWNGAGTIARHGGAGPTGTITVATVDLAIDLARCVRGPASGTTTLTSSEHVVVLTYACGETRWELDGVDRGALSSSS